MRPPRERRFERDDVAAKGVDVGARLRQTMEDARRGVAVDRGVRRIVRFALDGGVVHRAGVFDGEARSVEREAPSAALLAKRVAKALQVERASMARERRSPLRPVSKKHA
jgi:hypothetical protein